MVDKLKAENAALLKRLDSMQKSHFSLSKDYAALREDKERLDWLCMTDHWFDVPCDGNWTPESFRVAIDAARKEAQP